MRYDVRCNECGTEFEAVASVAERHNIKCQCGGGTTILIRKEAAVPHIFRPFWHEHLDVYPVYIESKKQWKQECDKRGLIANALL